MFLISFAFILLLFFLLFFFIIFAMFVFGRLILFFCIQEKLLSKHNKASLAKKKKIMRDLAFNEINRKLKPPKIKISLRSKSFETN